MKRVLFLMLSLLFTGAALSGKEEITLFLKEDFTKTAKLYQIGKGGTIRLEENGRALRIENGLATRRIPVPEGETLRFTAMIRAENVRKEQNVHWKGTRFAVFMGKDIRAGSRVFDGSFDWKRLSFKVNIPLDIHSLELQIGLKDASGCLMVKELKIEIIK